MAFSWLSGDTSGFGVGSGGEGLARYKWLLVVFGIILIVLILLSVAGVGLDVLGVGRSEPKPTELVFWKKWDPVIPLRVSATEVGPGMLFDRYTILIDMIWLNTRVRNEGAAANYRHILHRGSGEGADFLQAAQLSVRNLSPNTNAATPTGPTANEILARMPQGLPIRMNPGILADPYTNDMLIFVDTERDNQSYRESVRIPDIPMDQPFRMAVVVMPTMIEIYINCSLEVSKILEGRPRSMDAAWYGLIGPQPLNAAIQNLRLFNGAMGHQWLKPYCSKPPEFPDTVMASCGARAT